MSTQPSNFGSALAPRRVGASMGTLRSGSYAQIAIAGTVPPYESLTGVVEVLRDTMESPVSWAHAKLREMTGRAANWKSIGSAPPNAVAEKVALTILKAAHRIRPLEPTYVTASAEGGVGIVYRTAARYAAIECLNQGGIRLLWYDADKAPHSRRIKFSEKAIAGAIRKIAALLHGNA